MIRGAGARLVLSRRDSHDFYVANSTDLWSYDVGDDEAKRIPTRLPIIKPLVQNAFTLNASASMESGSVKLRGSQTVDGVDCWILSGKTPSSLKMTGVGSYKIGFWVGKADGIPRRIVIPDSDDTIITLRDIKINPGISPTRFVWSPPAGVKEVGILGF
jgi:outer membrane lipoprotein-sorting protein